jgi:hypothetical protein
MNNFKKGDKVLINTYSPPVEAIVADFYSLPFEQIPITEEFLIKKYYGKKVPVIEVFINGKLLSFISDVVKKA